MTGVEFLNAYVRDATPESWGVALSQKQAREVMAEIDRLTLAASRAVASRTREAKA